MQKSGVIAEDSEDRQRQKMMNHCGRPGIECLYIREDKIRTSLFISQWRHSQFTAAKIIKGRSRRTKSASGNVYYKI